MTTPVELFIPAAPKDYNKLPFVLRRVDRFLPDIQAVHVTTPTPLTIAPVYRFPVHMHADQDVLDYDMTRFQFRPHWCYQQFLKLFQRVTSTDWFLVMDADRFINRMLPLFNDDLPIMYLSNRDEYNPAYFAYTEAMLGMSRMYPHSFISEMTLYSRSLVDEMLQAAGMTQQEWLDKSAQIMNVERVIAEPELYGNFVYAKHYGLYHYLTLVDAMHGKYGGDYSDDELTALMAEMEGRSDVDIFSAHSWHD